MNRWQDLYNLDVVGHNRSDRLFGLPRFLFLQSPNGLIDFDTPQFIVEIVETAAKSHAPTDFESQSLFGGKTEIPVNNTEQLLLVFRETALHFFQKVQDVVADQFTLNIIKMLYKKPDLSHDFVIAEKFHFP